VSPPELSDEEEEVAVGIRTLFFPPLVLVWCGSEIIQQLH
jgi:hypothetical protein